MKPSHQYLRDAFRWDDATQRPVIEIVVERYEQLFNVLDRAPFRRRDLSPDLKQFLYEVSAWLPRSWAFQIEISVATEDHDEGCQREARDGIHNYFSYLLEVIRRDTRRQVRIVALFVSLAFVFLSCALLLGERLSATSFLPAFMLTGLTVGGWVLLWEALSIALIRRLDVREKISSYRRLATAEIVFVCPSR